MIGKLDLGCALVCGGVGLGMLVSLDAPAIRTGGLGAGLAFLELLIAVLLLSAAIGIAAHEHWKEGRTK
jgi:hypothetical protein